MQRQSSRSHAVLFGRRFCFDMRRREREREIGHRTLEVNGINMQVAEKGKGPGGAVLLLHGSPELWYSWHHHIRGLYRCPASLPTATPPPLPPSPPSLRHPPDDHSPSTLSISSWYFGANKKVNKHFGMITRAIWSSSVSRDAIFPFR